MLDDIGFSWLIGGAQGTGIERGANIFITAIAMGGYYIFGKREYYSNIMGEHSYFYVRINNKPIRSHIDRFHLLTAYDADTIFRHSLEGLENSAIIFNEANLKTKIKEVATIEERLKRDIINRMSNQGLEATIANILKEAVTRNIKVFPINYIEILSKISKKTGEKLGDLTRMNNVIAVSASLSLLKYDFNYLVKAINKSFKGKRKIIELNTLVAELTYDYINELGFQNEYSFSLKPIHKNENRILVNGNQAVALGKMVAGCRFQTYYPITPATDESEFLETYEMFDIENSNETHDKEKEILKNVGSTIVIETEDEIAAITMATGAALTGTRASTSTSGPGFSLMMEGLGWAGINEVPIVITHYQRSGPSTGMPTRMEQGDFRFALHAGHGEFPRIILASGDIEECFYDTIRAFNYAEKYQLPVIHLLDRFLAHSVITIKLFDYKKIKIERGKILNEKDLVELKKVNSSYKRFKFTDDGISPRIFIGTNNAIFWNTGDEHDELGHITEDVVIREKMMEKRMKKLDLADKEIPIEEKVNYFKINNPDLTIVSWGSTKGVIIDLIELLNRENIKIEFLQLRLLHPLPLNYIQNVLKNKRWICIENNYSAQVAGFIREKTGLKPNNVIVKYNGRPISLDELYLCVKRILNGNAKYREVLRGGA